MRMNTSFNRTSGLIKSNNPISLDALRANVPSIFADDKHHSRSERYTYVPTSDIVVALDKEGFRPFFACQAKVRTENLDRADFAKHMIRFRHASMINSDVANEIILVNSHDGSTSYQMMAGAFRLELFLELNSIISMSSKLFLGSKALPESKTSIQSSRPSGFLSGESGSGKPSSRRWHVPPERGFLHVACYVLLGRQLILASGYF